MDGTRSIGHRLPHHSGHLCSLLPPPTTTTTIHPTSPSARRRRLAPRSVVVVVVKRNVEPIVIVPIRLVLPLLIRSSQRRCPPPLRERHDKWPRCPPAFPYTLPPPPCRPLCRHDQNESENPVACRSSIVHPLWRMGTTTPPPPRQGWCARRMWMRSPPYESHRNRKGSCYRFFHSRRR